MSLIKGKVALVTGGHRGIGFFCCANLLMQGIKTIVIVGKDEKRGNESLCELETYGDGDLHFIKADITIVRDVKSIFDTTIKLCKQLDFFFHCSETIDEYTWDKAVELNLTSACRMNLMAMKDYLPNYKSSDEGVIINTASVSGLQPIAALPVYSSTKSGLIGLVRSLGTDYHYDKYKCRVMALCPGLVKELPLFVQTEPQGIDLDLFDEETCHWPTQASDRCARNYVELINKGTNGSVWVSEAQQCYEWKFPNRLGGADKSEDYVTINH